MELDSTSAATGSARTDERSGSPGEGELTRGAVVGRYVLLHRIGAGGMGVVYAAYDPDLDRKVALKLVLPRPGRDAHDGREWLLREAQALARLAHPNIVTVHDVGTHGEQVWLAMELVAGETLGAWAKGGRRRWPEIVQMLADVARGIAAAHAVGLVHRDLKPENVMVGRDGRVRVMDFGLAHGRGSAEDRLAAASGELSPTIGEEALAATFESDLKVQPELALLNAQLTRAGAIQGTPAYMAPEQWRGQEAGAATDQFGWSVMAWELLHGERPFAGATIAELATAVTSGRRRPPPRGHGVPGWLGRVIERGLALEPTQRWPSMAALLSALERGRTRARVRTTALVLSGVAALAAGAVGVRRWEVAQRVAACEASGAEIAGVWHDGARRQVRDAFVASGVAYAATTADKVTPWLDEHAAAWQRARTQACIDAEVAGTWDADTFDRAVWCLEERRNALGAMVAEFARADAQTVHEAVASAAGLEPPARCTDADLLRHRPAPPSTGRAAVEAVRLDLARVSALGIAGKFEAARTAARAASEAAEQVPDWPPLLAEARVREGRVLEALGDYEEAEAMLSEAYYAAARAGAWNVAVGASIDLTILVGQRRGREAEGRAWARHAEVAIAYAGDRTGLEEAQRLANLAVVHESAGEYAEARTMLEQSLALWERALGPDHHDVAVPASNLGIAHLRMGDFAAARALLARALAITEAELGPEHPRVAGALVNLSNVSYETGDFAGARSLGERALAIHEKALGDEHPFVADDLHNLSTVHLITGDPSEALRLAGRALKIREEALGPDHPDLVASHDNLASIHDAMGDFAAARASYERAIAVAEKALGPDHPNLAITLSNLGTTLLDAGELEEAQRLLTRALTIREEVLGREHHDVAASLAFLARVELARGRPREALPLLERATAIFDAHEGAQEEEWAAYLDLARALAGGGGDLARAVAAAQKARDGFEAAGPGMTDELAAARQWLAEHERPGPPAPRG